MATRIKRYEIEASKLDELLLRIQNEMGPGALVETREFRSGALLGFIGGKKMVEAIATLELEHLEGGGVGTVEPVEQPPAADPGADDAGLEDSLLADSAAVPEEPEVALEPVAPAGARHGDEGPGPQYQPPRPAGTAPRMPVALDEVDSLAYALGQLAQHAGSAESFFAQDSSGPNVTREAAARAKAVHGLDVEAELAALDAAEAVRSKQAPVEQPAETYSSEPQSAEQRYLAAQAMMGSGLPELPMSALESTPAQAEPEASEADSDQHWIADEPAQPAAPQELLAEPGTGGGWEALDDDDDDAEEPDWDSGAGLAMDLAREAPGWAPEPEVEVDSHALPAAVGEPEPVSTLDIEAELVAAEAAAQEARLLAARAPEPDGGLPFGGFEPAAEPAAEAEPASALEPTAQPEATRGDLFADSQLSPDEPVSEETAELDSAALLLQDETADSLLELDMSGTERLPAAEQGSQLEQAAPQLPFEVLKLMDDIKQSISGLQSTVKDLAAAQGRVVDAATQAAEAAAQAAVDRLLAAEAQRRAADDERRQAEQRRYEEELAMLREAAAQITAAATAAADSPAPVAGGGALLDHSAGFGAIERQVYDMLLDWNIGHYDALELLNIALAAMEPGSSPTVDGLITAVSDEICRNVLLGDGIRLSRTPPGKAIALVGPTGVGKTTTIAKLAAAFAFQQGKRVSLISMDNYRIAAAEQLRTYSDIMGLDLDIVFSKGEFDTIMSRRRSSDLILIDTAGRSPNNQKQIQELREIFMVHPPDEVHLVVAAGTRRDDMRLILDAFKPLSYDHLIVSKLDETRSLGALYNLTRSCTLPISYFAVGQSVPEDIRTATLPFIKQWIAQGRIL